MVNNYEITTGTDNFRELVSTDQINVDPNKLFVDNTMLIKDFLDSSGKVLLITRPRRWGKTLALSMIQHFLSKEVKKLPTKDLFTNLKITAYLNNDRYNKYQVRHPVIFITFKDLHGNSFEEIKQKIEEKVSNLYKEHDYLLTALQNKDPKFTWNEISLNDYKNKFIKIVESNANNAELINSIKLLSELLNVYHNNKVFILIDEYDVRHASAKITSSCECYRKSATEHISYQNWSTH